MNTRTKILSLALGVVSILTPLGVFAADQAPTHGTAAIIATVSVRDASVSAAGRTAEISFSLYNRQGIQPDVKYGFTIVPANGASQAIDESIAAETLSIGNGESVSRTMKYTAPSYVPAGTYLIWVEAATSNGLPLGNALAGKVTFAKSDAGHATVDSSNCYYIVSGTSAHHPFSQAVVAGASDRITATCSVQSHFSSTHTVTPDVQTYKRSQFGERVFDQGGLHPISLAPGETKTFSFEATPSKAPGGYRVTVLLLDTANSLDATTPIVANPVSFQYVFAGDSATILNVTLDKNQYARGTTALATISWSGTSVATSSSGLTLVNTLTGRSGACGEPSVLSVGPTGFGTRVYIPVNTLCINPSLAVVIKAADGSILDQKTITIQSSRQTASAPVVVRELLFLVVTLLLLGGVLFVLHAVRKRI